MSLTGIVAGATVANYINKKTDAQKGVTKSDKVKYVLANKVAGAGIAAGGYAAVNSAYVNPDGKLAKVATKIWDKGANFTKSTGKKILNSKTSLKLQHKFKELGGKEKVETLFAKVKDSKVFSQLKNSSIAQKGKEALQSAGKWVKTNPAAAKTFGVLAAGTIVLSKVIDKAFKGKEIRQDNREKAKDLFTPKFKAEV